MQNSVFVFGTDLKHEGTEAVLDALRTRAGATDVAFSATYHDARDVFPHNPRYHVYRHEGDIAWFRSRGTLYPDGFVPKLAEAADGEDMLADLCASAENRGMSVSAWTIFLHNSRLATARPDCATRNVYGDAYLSDLCPANPEVRAYCRGLASDIARYPVKRLLAEALHYRTLEHGEHHERYLIALPGWARGLMSLCFCPHCRAAGTAAGVDMEALADAIQGALDPVWQGQPVPDRSTLSDEWLHELETFRQQRCKIVTSLVAEVKSVLEPAGVALCFIDHAGAMAHVLPGVTAEDDVIDVARDLLGTDPAAVAEAADEYLVLGYTGSAEALMSQLRRYRDKLGAATRMGVALRPLAIDCPNPGNLRAKAQAARASGASSLAFYHYAMMPLDRLDWIAGALSTEDPS
ncbi:hypothetical protein [Tropicimonas sp. IMCC6043]|uniref:hypothetical protein n=1 Tax=Tropicimonas sp. IMCC6043 TaxID=2510645 RepID=UPI00101BE973|nr:hypothetical protein [Tropicimonas sp. IMCC6043]RYH07529.1 hypothetical protein EU800_19745 [Tropicimonas sp. IMCC6043]